MKVSDAFPSEFLKAADIGNHQVKVLISHVEMRDVGDDTKPVIFFQNKKKGLVCNVTNANAIAQYYGDDMDLWAGHPIEMFTMMVTFQGRTQPAIRVRIPITHAAPSAFSKPLPELENPADDGDSIPF